MLNVDRMTGQLETLEWAYARITDGRELITHQDGTHFRFEDGAVARSLPDAIQQGRALYDHVATQLRRSAG